MKIERIIGCYRCQLFYASNTRLPKLIKQTGQHIANNKFPQNEKKIQIFESYDSKFFKKEYINKTQTQSLAIL
jgi:hypothetical protein